MTIGTNGPGAVTLGPEDRARAVAEVKAVLRVVAGDEDALIAAFVETTLGLAEQFTGRVLIARAMEETIAADARWARLSAAPVLAIAGVSAPDAGGADAGGGAALPAAAYAIDIDARGEGWVRTIDPRGAARVVVAFTAGAAAGWNDVPAPIRQGAVMLAAHLFGERDAAIAPPAAVTALWRPFRTIVLAGALARERRAC